MFNWTFLSIALPLVLAIMGAVLAIKLPESDDRLARILWVLSFVGVGALAVWAGIRDRQELTEQALGGDQICAVSILFSPGMDVNGTFPLVLSNMGDQPLYDVTLAIGKSIDIIAKRTIYFSMLPPWEMFRRLDINVPLGRYIIHITTKANTNMGFFENLTLTNKNGQIHQSYYVRRIGSEKRLMNVP